MGREHYAHHNEDADRVWWQEEGQFGHDLGTDEEIKQAVYARSDDYDDDFDFEMNA